MMPGMPPNQMVPNRRQNEYQYGYPPPQTHPAYYHPHQYGYPQPHAPHHPQQWYPQQQYPQQPYPQGPRHYQQYPTMPPPQQQHIPVVVSSQPHMHPYNHTPMARPHMPTPPVSHAQTPLQAAPSTSFVPSLPRQSPAPSTLSAQSEIVATPPPPSTASRPSTAAEPTTEVSDTDSMVFGKASFEAPLPWLSVPDEPFPAAVRRRRRRHGQVASTAPLLELPIREIDVPRDGNPQADESSEAGEITEEQTESQASTVAAPSDHETPATSQAPSEVDEQPETPSSVVQTVPASNHARVPTRPVVPIIPKVPVPTARKPSVPPHQDAAKEAPPTPAVGSSPNSETAKSSDTVATETASTQSEESTPAPAPRALPKSWADLVRTKPAPSSASASSLPNGVVSSDSTGVPKASTLAEAIRAFTVDSTEKVSFIKPRGLVNTGNMCYMNSVLQTLTFCTPFYDFVDLVGKRFAHSFKSDTPLLDAMIFLLREYPVIDSAASVEQLRLRLKSEELEQFGDAFTPENVYDAIKRLPRFSSMRRGHQQDAEEFLIFFLEQLHDECVKVINSIPISAIETTEPMSPASERSSVADAGWQEVGPKQKAATTHTSGHSYNETPITKIFGGTLRSELRVPGKKNSVTFQPYQPLQLDIGAHDVHNIVDALKGLTRSETIHGDFNSQRGPEVAATKQIFIETLPPVLILHLKRFEYNNMGGTQKIWKKVGYPLELTVPKEVFPQQKRGQLSISGLPKYTLEGVIYHHGKNASSGHYTVDLRRQEGKEWIRVDDTIIRRLRPEDVVEGGAEEDPKVLAKALEQHKKDTPGKNLFDQFGAVDEEDNKSESGWNTAGTKDAGNKKWSAIANGTATPSSAGAKTPRKENVKDNKVAYILFYRRI